MKKFKISYFYLATGMEGDANTLSELDITAENKDLAIFNYWKINGYYKDLDFDKFMSIPTNEREWGLSCEEIDLA